MRWTESWSSTIIAIKDIVHAVLSSSLLKVSLTSATNTTSVARNVALDGIAYKTHIISRRKNSNF